MGRASQQPEDLFNNTASKIRYEAYSRLQAAAVAFGEQIEVPEIVAIGGQSDGKSSLLEAFLGVSRAAGPRLRTRLTVSASDRHQLHTAGGGSCRQLTKRSPVRKDILCICLLSRNGEDRFTYT